MRSESYRMIQATDGTNIKNSSPGSFIKLPGLIFFFFFFLTLRSQNSLPNFNFTHLIGRIIIGHLPTFLQNIILVRSNVNQTKPNRFSLVFGSNLWNRRARQRAISQPYDLAISDTTHYLIWSGLLFESFLSLVSVLFLEIWGLALFMSVHE